MANYNTDLDDWGATGEKPPSGYAYEEDVPPVDFYDNYLMNNVINDIQHLTSLTNDRLESEAGTSRPSSPEDGHLFADSDDGKLEWYNPSSGAWSRALDATGDKLDGVIDMGGYQIEDSTGSLTLDGTVEVTTGNLKVSNGQLSEQSNRVATRTWATGSNISHSELSDAPSSSHHTRYSDNEARSAVEAGNVSRIEGVNGHRISFSANNGYIEIHDHSGSRNRLVTADTYVNNGSDSNGQSWLSDHLPASDAHHTRYSDSEARSAVGGSTVTGGLIVQDSNRHSYNGLTSTTAKNGHLMLDSNGGNLYLNWDESGGDVRVQGSKMRVESKLDMRGNIAYNFEQVEFNDIEHSTLRSRALGWDGSQGGGGVNGGLIVQDDSGDKAWVVHSSDDAYDIQKNGSDKFGVINFKT